MGGGLAAIRRFFFFKGGRGERKKKIHKGIIGRGHDLRLLRYMLISPKSGNFFFPVTVLHPIVHPNLRSVIKTQRTPKRVVVYLFTPSIPKSIRPSPFLFRLESNAFPDGSVGRIEKKKTLKKKKNSPEVSE